MPTASFLAGMETWASAWDICLFVSSCRFGSGTLLSFKFSLESTRPDIFMKFVFFFLRKKKSNKKWGFFFSIFVKINFASLFQRGLRPGLNLMPFLT